MCVDPQIHDGDCKASEVINSILTVLNRYVSIVWSLAAILYLENLKRTHKPYNIIFNLLKAVSIW